MAYVSAEDAMKARKVDLISYLEAKGETFKKEGNYYRHTEHDSLIIKGNQYAWNSRGEKGYGAISFAMMYYDMTFPQAVMDIQKGDYKEFDRSKAEEERKKEQQPFSYPKHLEVNKQTEIKEYLIHERKIDPRLVNWLIKKGLIAQDKKNNVVFKWREEGGKGKVIGMNRQGTVKMENKRGSFKQIVPNYEKINAGFTVDVGKPDKIYFYEDPIDMLSHWSIKQNKIQNARLVSMHGLKSKTVIQSLMDAKKEGYDIKEVIMAVDNDKAGKDFIQTMKCFVDLREDIPTNEKDWNDVRKKQVNEQQAKETAQPKKMKPIKEVERSV
ncbi:DUF3991 and TOPRIM domain-containing protein [Bacillus thuringiensis]|uniref:DUF3991 domain-containing protein n=1 Tax=Bacillus thuringiensis TaxID=1428 RepID=B0FXT6_BACTU|nr:DUF3991 and TOPRIM domain-containing protein [Bacillus thuringiensis]ABY68495.1 hypothetical protein pFR55_ORF014 [Bacillus thuringiensis]OMH24364.1 hypothetical protein BUM91_30320 [Bacillus thuringiensis]